MYFFVAYFMVDGPTLNQMPDINNKNVHVLVYEVIYFSAHH